MKIIVEVFDFLFKILSYLIIALLCMLSVFEHEILVNMDTNELIFVCTLSLIGIFNKTDKI